MTNVINCSIYADFNLIFSACG